MRTFAVSDVAPSPRPLEATSLEVSLARRFAGSSEAERTAHRAGRPELPVVAIEASGANQDHLVCSPDDWNVTHPLVEAVHIAFAEHYPLLLSPDDVWLCLAQGFGLYVEANAEALRSRFVRHPGKLTLGLRRDDFVKGSPDNDWQGCLAGWSDAIAAHIGKKRDLVVSAFSTTGPIERAASELVLMSAMKSYFGFRLETLCGIPSITLLGTVDDWRAIRRRAEVLAEFDLADWARVLLPVLDQFVAAASGDVDREFWRSIYKRSDHSGGPYVTGWINVLFPCLCNQGRITPNRSALTWSKDINQPFCGATLGDFRGPLPVHVDPEVAVYPDSGKVGFSTALGGPGGGLFELQRLGASRGVLRRRGRLIATPHTRLDCLRARSPQRSGSADQVWSP